MAQLVNASEGGLGVEAFVSFEPGEMLEGQLGDVQLGAVV
jgi:hypothetical protein